MFRKIVKDYPFSLGVTGTRHHITKLQFHTSTKIIQTFYDLYGNQKPHLHHGDCIGADYAMSTIAQNIGYWTVSHPPIQSGYRAYLKSDETRTQKDYLVRNVDIIYSSDVLLGVPNSFNNQTRSGTWYTIRYALGIDKPVIVVYPDGTCKFTTKYKDELKSLLNMK